MDLLKVPFLGNEITIVAHNGEPYVAMRSIVDGMGLAWQPQHEKLKQRFESTVTEIVMVAQDGKPRLMTCMALRKMPAWMYSIHANKVKPEKRNMIIRYQEECDEVLWQYWTTGYVKRESVKAQLAELAEIESESKSRGSDAGRALYQRKVEKHDIARQVQFFEGQLEQLDLFADTLQ